ncbi:fibrobacter succinogenes major paralogous domain-containing protein [Draconibacterium sp.]|nr:fibrobacter succinogenes major paralogous domain-containing protein [Draconibacterium sp.]
MKFYVKASLFCLAFLASCEKLELYWDLPNLPVVETLEPESFCCLSVKVGCNLVFLGDSPAVCGICYSQFPTPTIVDSMVICGENTGTHKTKIDNLSDQITYYIRAFASNDDGTVYGEQKQFTTGIGEVGTFTDSRDSKIYKTVKIGSQTWMAENLAFLPSVSPPTEESYDYAHYYVYGYNGKNTSTAKETHNYKTYGVLYNWQAANEACPAGWHLPSDEEWKQLEKSVGSYVAKYLKATSWWRSSGNGTDYFGFSGLPGGYRDYYDRFNYIGYYGYWWSSTEKIEDNASYLRMQYNSSLQKSSNYDKRVGFSVRCLKD